MHCFGCGRQSTRTDYCEWCRRPHGQPGQPPPGGAPPNPNATQPLAPGMQPTQPLPYGAQPTTQMPYPPGAQPTRRVALTGEVVEGPPAPPMPTQAMPPHAMPPQGYHGTPGPGPRTYMSNDITLDFDEVSPMGERWEKALAFCFSIVALSMLMVHFVPNSIMAVAYLDMFLLMFALGATRAIPFFEDAMFDCGVMLGVSLLCGPIIGLVAYLIVGAIKQECNGAIVALTIISIVLPQLLRIPLFHNTENAYPFLMMGLFSILSFMATFVGFLGWLCASFFRPLNE